MQQENLKTDLILGHNIHTTHGFLSSVDYAEQTDSNVFQIFLSSPHQYNGSRRKTHELQSLGKKALERKIQILVHGSLILNFCNGPESFIHKSSAKNLITDLTESVLLNAIGVVIHMGKNVEKLKLSYEQAVNNFVQGVAYCLDNSPENSIVILETGAGQGQEICTSISELGLLYKSFKTKHQRRIKFCIDTCHIFASGHNIGDISYVNFFVPYIDIYLGWSNVAAIHLNDSCKDVNCKVDRHADIGKGKIDIDGLKQFTIECGKRKIPIVLETPATFLDEINNKRFTHHDQIKLVKSWF